MNSLNGSIKYVTICDIYVHVLVHVYVSHACEQINDCISSGYFV